MRQTTIARIRAFMEDYARRGVFRGFSEQAASPGSVAFKLLWHREREFDLLVDADRQTIRMPIVLPKLPADIYADFKAFVKSHHDADLPVHRRIDPALARISCASRHGDVALTIKLKTGDYEYGLQRLIHLVHETYLIFLADGRYGDYRTAQLGASPDLG